MIYYITDKIHSSVQNSDIVTEKTIKDVLKDLKDKTILTNHFQTIKKL